MASILKLPQNSVKTEKGVEKNSPPEDGMVVLTLSDDGWIRSCNKAAGKLLGCSTSELLWQHISMLLPQLGQTPLMLKEQINPRLRYLSRIGHRFEVVAPNGARIFSRLFFNDVANPERHNLCLIICPFDGEAQLRPH